MLSASHQSKGCRSVTKRHGTVGTCKSHTHTLNLSNYTQACFFPTHPCYNLARANHARQKHRHTCSCISHPPTLSHTHTANRLTVHTLFCPPSDAPCQGSSCTSCAVSPPRGSWPGPHASCYGTFGHSSPRQPLLWPSGSSSPSQGARCGQTKQGRAKGVEVNKMAQRSRTIRQACGCGIDLMVSQDPVAHFQG